MTEMKVGSEVNLVHYMLFLGATYLSIPTKKCGELLFTLFNDIRLTHIYLLHQSDTELVEFLVERFLLAFVEGGVGAAMLLEEVIEDILGEQAHHEDIDHRTSHQTQRYELPRDTLP